MNNVNDILVNYKKIPYDFFEWNSNDNIIHVKSIQVFKVTDKCMIDFLNNEIVLSKKFIKDFFEKNIKIGTIVVFNEDLCLSLLFNKDGNVIGKSKLLYEEQDDIIKRFSDLKIKDINYKTIKTESYNKYLTRSKIELISNIKKYIDNLYKNNSNDELKYIYYDCFCAYGNDINLIYNEILNGINEGNIKIINKLKNYLKYMKNSIKK